MDERAMEVLKFWFGPPAASRDEVMKKIDRWFAGGPDFDREVQERFGSLVDAAVRGDLDDWAQSTRHRLALVILLDQLTRNVYRNDRKTYEGDPKAQRLALEAFDKGLDRDLTFVERTFLSMPLLHSEDISLHRRLEPIRQALGENCAPEYTQMHAMYSEQCGKYRDVLHRFGRFPHRNAIFGRVSTPEEEEFLRDWAERAPPAGMPKSG